jgi:Zn-dependent peptidase ImmA (M78 family)/transcriptional regulator with XRE-family HTH domain
MSTVSIQPALIRWARERAGLAVDELVGRFPRYSLWESGEASPTLHQVEQLAQKTHTPLGYLFLPEPPVERLPVPDFRTVGDQGVRCRPSPDLLDTIQSMQRRQDWLREYLAEQGETPLPFIGSVRLGDAPEVVVEDMRRVLGITPSWARDHDTWESALRDLRRVIETAGVVAVVNGIVGNNTHRVLKPGEFRGFVLCDPLAPLVFVNGADSKSAQMFTLAHEMAHLWLGRDGVFDLPGLQPSNDEVEQFCNRVAAEFLVPAAEFGGAWSASTESSRRFHFVANRFKVSPVVAARRALDLGVITRTEFFAFYRDYRDGETKRDARRASGGDFYANQDYRVGQRFGEAVVQAVNQGRILYTEAYQLTGLHGDTFERFAKGITARL